MITITKGVARLKADEGCKTAAMPLDKFITAISPPKLDIILPNGVKMWVQKGNHFMAVYEMSPGVHSLKWKDAVVRDRDGCIIRSTIKTRRLALPYVIFLVPFVYTGGKLIAHHVNIECYYRNRPIEDPSDKLFYPALPNCGEWNANGYRLPSWICTCKGNLQLSSYEPTDTRRVWATIGRLRNHFLGSTFNDDWNGHWNLYCEWEKASKRITDLNKWEAATKKNPAFILNIDWMPAERNLKDTIDYTLSCLTQEVYSHHLERLIFEHREPRLL